MKITVTMYAIASLLCVAVGCRSEPNVADVQLEIELDAKGLLGTRHRYNVPSQSYLFVPGDLNDDSVSDIIVGDTYHINECKISAYSGSNGNLIWQTTKEQIGGRIDCLSLISDINGDGCLDVYAGLSRYSPMYFLSGKDGQVIARHEAPDQPGMHVGQGPRFSGDFNADGNVELFFEGNELAMQRFTVEPFSYEGMIEILPEQPYAKRIAVPNFQDENGDGILDHLISSAVQLNSKDEVYQWEMNVISGKDLSSLRTFVTDRPRIGHNAAGYAMLGDVDGDGQVDFAFGSGAGATDNPRMSVLRAFSGRDGSPLWEINGSQFDGVSIVLTGVDVPQPTSDWKPPPGARIANYDFGFHGTIKAIPDINGDQVIDLAMMHLSDHKIYVFSGVDGAFLKSIGLPSDQQFSSKDIAVLDDLDSGGDWQIAVITRKESSKKPHLTILKIE